MSAGYGGLSNREVREMSDLDETIKAFADRNGIDLDRVEVSRVPASGGTVHALTIRAHDGAEDRVRILISDGLTEREAASALRKELIHFARESDTAAALQERVSSKEAGGSPPDIQIGAVLIPDEQTSPEGVLIKATSIAWKAVVDQISADWTRAYQISPRMWEEIIAGAYWNAGYDEVTLTPRSGDHGRDVIAIKKGVGCIKLINSVKANAPGNLVGYDDVRALLGVMSGERDTSKGVLTTTSDFPPNILKDRFIAPFVPYRLELMNGTMLLAWLRSLSEQ